MNVKDFDKLPASVIFDVLNANENESVDFTIEQKMAMFRALKIKYDIYAFSKLMSMRPEIILYMKPPSDMYKDQYNAYYPLHANRCHGVTDRDLQENKNSLTKECANVLYPFLKVDHIDWNNVTENDIIVAIKENPTLYAEVPNSKLTKKMRRTYIETITFIPAMYTAAVL